MTTNAEHIASIVSAAEEALFEKFDSLHKRNIHDDEVIHFLRDEGHKLLADRYIEWSGAVDPDSDVNNTTTSPDGVTDPGTNPSDLQMQAALTEARVVESTGDITTVEQLALLTDGVVLVLNGGRAAQVMRDETRHDLLIAGSDLWENIMQLDNDDQWQIVDAGQRRELAAFLPATILGSSK